MDWDAVGDAVSMATFPPLSRVARRRFLTASLTASPFAESGWYKGPPVVVGFRAETNDFKAKPLIFVVVEQHWAEERTALTGVKTRLARPGWHRQGKTTEKIL